MTIKLFKKEITSCFFNIIIYIIPRTSLTVNFIGEFMSLYEAFEILPVLGALACSSIVLSAAFTIYLFNRVVFGGSYSKHFTFSFLI